MIRQHRLTTVAVGLAVTVVAGGVAAGFGWLPIPPFDALRLPEAENLPGKLLLAIVAVALGQVATTRVRVGTGSARLGWGEAAIVVVCSMLPTALVPLAVAAGSAAAHLSIAACRPRRRPENLPYGIAALIMAGTVSATVVAALGPAFDRPPSLRVLLALGAGAVLYTVTASLGAALRVAASHGGRITSVFVDTMRSKLLMMGGNIGVGVLIVIICYSGASFLILLPPLLWLLHHLYTLRLRADDDSRVWQEFAEATGALNRLHEQAAAAAGIAGAIRLFHPERVEIVIGGSNGRVRRYRGEPGGEVVESIDAVAPDGGDPRGADGALVRALAVRQLRVGELRLYGVDQPRQRDKLMLGAYGDALAAALHDAMTHGELRAMSERTTYDAVHDPLTGLSNRAALLARGNSALRALEPNASAGLLLLDINRFKEVNNALGHTAGDELLRVLALRLRDSGLPGDLLARLGGDEFALLITQLPEGCPELALRAAVARARRLGAQLAEPTEVAGVTLSVEASAGVVVAPAGEVDLAELLRRADIAMYHAKHGGQPVASYDPVRDEASTDRLALLAELREALAAGAGSAGRAGGQDQLSIEMQPAVSLASGGTRSDAQIVGVEALVRWRHPRRGRLLPQEFMPTVEQSELIGPLTRWVLDRALGVAAQWQAAGVDVPVSVNLSARSLTDRRLPAEVKSLLTRHNIPAGTLILEITETVVMSELPVVDEVLAKLRRIGVQLAVDDFGTGYSPLTFLTRVQVHEVKIDRVFVTRMTESAEAMAIVRTTVELARELGLRVVAEGVESAEQRTALAALGCTAAQGFHFYPPLAPSKVTHILRDRQSSRPRRLPEEHTG